MQTLVPLNENLNYVKGKLNHKIPKLQTGMTAFGKAYHRNQGNLVPNVRMANTSMTTLYFGP